MSDETEDALLAIHVRVDERAAELARRHAARLQCAKGCTDCCVDDLTVFEVEADRIRRGHVELLQSGQPHPRGKCAFLDADGACRIYEDRPFVCRTQGLPLLWFEETADGDITESRDICPLNAEGEPLERLRPEECWTLGTVELELSALQRKARGNQSRVALRALFEHAGD